MLTSDALRQLASRLKQAPLLPHGAGAAVDHGTSDLERLLPHRPPMLLVDSIDAIDVGGRAARGRRYLAPTDAGFAGHFPGDPIYPGALVVEAIGQLGLTLLHFTEAGDVGVPHATCARRVRAVHIHRATFLSSFLPGDTITLHAQIVEMGGLTMIAAGQAWNRNTLAAFAVSEVYIDE
jgi:3-hydroxymyristoyl/3-hydroxydecanoyl-(acyl carrier protein) dehydratase